MSENAEEPPKDALGLDLDSLKITDTQPPEKSDVNVPEQPQATPNTSKDDKTQSPTIQRSPSTAEATTPKEEQADHLQKPHGPNAAPPREKKKPYVNPERVRTGGAPREKLSEEELAERMVRIREQNEKIKLRRLDVEEDEREFKKKQDEERAKLARNKRVQETIDKTREQNARRKLEKIQNREWDAGKPGVKKNGNEGSNIPSHPLHSGNIGIRGAVRGGGAGRGRGRGFGGPPPITNGNKSDEDTPTPAPAAATPAASS